MSSTVARLPLNVRIVEMPECPGSREAEIFFTRELDRLMPQFANRPITSGSGTLTVRLHLDSTGQLRAREVPPHLLLSGR